MPLSCHLLLCFPRCESLQTHQASHTGHRAPCNAHVSLRQHAVSSLKAWWRWMFCYMRFSSSTWSNTHTHTTPNMLSIFTEMPGSRGTKYYGFFHVRKRESQTGRTASIELSDAVRPIRIRRSRRYRWLDVTRVVKYKVNHPKREIFCHHSHTLVLLPYGGWDVLHWLISHVNCHALHSLKKIIPDRQASWLIYIYIRTHDKPERLLHSWTVDKPTKTEKLNGTFV